MDLELAKEQHPVCAKSTSNRDDDGHVQPGKLLINIFLPQTPEPPGQETETGRWFVHFCFGVLFFFISSSGDTNLPFVYGPLPPKMDGTICVAATVETLCLHSRQSTLDVMLRFMFVLCYNT